MIHSNPISDILNYNIYLLNVYGWIITKYEFVVYSFATYLEIWETNLRLWSARLLQCLDGDVLVSSRPKDIAVDDPVGLIEDRPGYPDDGLRLFGRDLPQFCDNLGG